MAAIILGQVYKPSAGLTTGTETEFELSGVEAKVLMALNHEGCHVELYEDHGDDCLEQVFKAGFNSNFFSQVIFSGSNWICKVTPKTDEAWFRWRAE